MPRYAIAIFQHFRDFFGRINVFADYHMIVGNDGLPVERVHQAPHNLPGDKTDFFIRVGYNRLVGSAIGFQHWCINHLLPQPFKIAAPRLWLTQASQNALKQFSAFR